MNPGPPRAPALSLLLLGGFEARLASGKARALPKKIQAFVAYLALAPELRCSRTELATLLWGDTGRVQAQQNLRQTLAALRRGLGPIAGKVLAIDPTTIGLNRTAVEVDVTRFEELARKDSPDALAKAAALYRGDLLLGLDIDAAEFDEWLATRRQRLAELATNALMRLLVHQAKARTFDAAVQTASRVLAMDRLHEPAHRALMQVYLAQGRRPDALRQYQECVAVLQRELGVEPTAETKAVYAQILREPAGAAPRARPARTDAQAHVHDAAASPFVGRARELARVRAAMDEAFAGRSCAVALLGEAGIGKSRLMGQVAAEAARRGARVLVGRSHRADQIFALGPWRDALREGRVLADPEVGRALGFAARTEIIRLVPELAEEPTAWKGVEDAARLFDAIAALLDALAAAQPLVVAIEDVHWADDMTLRLVSWLSRRRQARRTLVILTVRDEEIADGPGVGDLLTDLERDARLVRVQLAPLSRDETAALVGALSRSGAAPHLPRLADQVWAASEGHPFMVVETMHAVDEGGGAATLPALPLPERVRRVVTTRVERLSPGARGLLAVAAVIGRSIDFALLQRAALLDDASAATALEELVRRRLLRVAGDQFEFAHASIRDVVYGDLLAPRRQLLHRQTMQAILALRAAALEPHYGALGAHAWEGELWGDAVSYFRRAGQWALARSFNREAAGAFERAIAALDRAHQPDAAALAIDVRLDLRNVLVLLGDVERAAEPLETARGLAERLGDPVRLGRVWAQTSSHYWWTGRPVDALAAAETAARFAEETGDRALGVAATLGRGYAYQNLGDHREAQRVLDGLFATLPLPEPDRYAELLPVVSARAQALLALAHCGDFDDALARARDFFARAEAADHRYLMIHARWCLAEVHLHRGDGGEAIPLLEQALALFVDRADFWMHANLLGALGYAELLAGRVDEGLRRMHEALDAYRSRIGFTRLLARLAEASVIAGRLDEARELAARCIEDTRAHGERGYEAWGLRVLGEATGDARHFQEALAIAEPRDMRPMIAHCRFGLSRLSPGGDHLRVAIALYREMGMRRWLEEAEKTSR